MRSVELFAGCGGLALGIARAGFSHDLIVECDADSIATLTENKRRKLKHIRNWEIEQVDSRELNYSSYGGVALLSGGPPCQPFSIGGKHLGPRDPRNMWPEAIRAIREIRPKAFILENVRGLLRPDFSDYLEYIELQLTFVGYKNRPHETWRQHLTRLRKHAVSSRRSAPNYKVVAQSINAADYGAPQKRHRAIIVGIAHEYGGDWGFPTPTHSQEALAWSKHIDSSYWKKHDIRKVSNSSSVSERQALERANALKRKPKELPWVTVRDAIADLPRPKKESELQGHWQHHGAKVYTNHTGSSLDEPAKALKSGDHGVPGGENMLVKRDGSVRYFTVREMARLQGFPDDYYVSGSWKAATRQLGNAVPTMVGELVGRTVLKTIKGAKL